ncbi:MAG: rod shape-determining protein MreC [Spirochaetales bacterium]
MGRVRNYIRSHKVGFLLGAYLAFSLFSISLSTHTILISPKEMGLSLVSVFQKSISGTRLFLSETLDSIRTLHRLKQEYEQALEKVRYYEKIERELANLEEENRRLREVLQFSLQIPYENIPARVVGRDPQNYFSTLTINKGSLQGIEKNMPVVSFQGGKQGLVGKILQTGFNTSLVQPIYDPTSYIAARLVQSRYEGLVNGSVEEKIYMYYVKRFARMNIQSGELVVTSGLNSLFPPDIPIGVLRAVHAREYDTSLILEIDPIIDFGKIEYVFVLKPKGGKP